MRWTLKLRTTSLCKNDFEVITFEGNSHVGIQILIVLNCVVLWSILLLHECSCFVELIKRVGEKR